MKIIYFGLLLVVFLIFSTPVFAFHGRGGSLTYTYMGVGSTANTSKYTVKVRHYIDCLTPAPPNDDNVTIGVYDALTDASVTTLKPTLTNTINLAHTSSNPCFTPAVTICYIIKEFTVTVDLADNTNGYILTEKEFKRASNILNISNSSNYGITNTNTIPGTINGKTYRNNICPQFIAERDTAIICYQTAFSYSFTANDPDGDSLSYSFCSAKGDLAPDRNGTNPLTPPYSDLPYSSGFSGDSPLGSAVTINPTTGVISGTAPLEIGAYVVSVCVSEFRNGVLIGVTKKEVQIAVANCALTAAILKISYINCDNLNFTFQNESTASNIVTYKWDFGDTTISTDVSSKPTPTYAYNSAGTYTLKLLVTNSGGCAYSTFATVKAYPGFLPKFSFTGSCYQSPIQFTNLTTFNKLDSAILWNWNFGETSFDKDKSSLKNPSYTYANAGLYTVRLTVKSSKGCDSTATLSLKAKDKPEIKLSPDTIMCSKDRLTISAQATGTSYSWLPTTYLNNPNILSPVIIPPQKADTSIRYILKVTENECVGTDSILVKILPFISVKFLHDTVLCASDTITLQPISEALTYLWTQNTNTLSSTTIKNPQSFPTKTVTYHVQANLGTCQDVSQTTVFVSPYPKATVSADTTICYNGTVLLKANIIQGTHFIWHPIKDSVNTMLLVQPTDTTTYQFVVRDTLYCPKIITYPITVNVVPEVMIHVGNDTAIVLNELLTMHAASNVSSASYRWTPTIYVLSNSDTTANPFIKAVAALYDSVYYTSTATTIQGCKGTDGLWVKIFKTGPDIFVPSAFSPNGDGINDILKAIPVGIKRFDYFKIFNRFGQQVFSSTDAFKGWNGMLQGIKQDSNTFVYITQGVDYLGNVIFRKGTTTIVR